VPGTMPPGYEPPKDWKKGDPMIPGLTPPEVEKRRRNEASKGSDRDVTPEETSEPESQPVEP